VVFKGIGSAPFWGVYSVDLGSQHSLYNVILLKCSIGQKKEVCLLRDPAVRCSESFSAGHGYHCWEHNKEEMFVLGTMLSLFSISL